MLRTPAPVAVTALAILAGLGAALLLGSPAAAVTAAPPSPPVATPHALAAVSHLDAAISGLATRFAASRAALVPPPAPVAPSPVAPSPAAPAPADVPAAPAPADVPAAPAAAAVPRPAAPVATLPPLVVPPQSYEAPITVVDGGGTPPQANDPAPVYPAG